MSGRGRGVSNKPAWMTRGEGGGGGGFDNGPPPHHHPMMDDYGPPRGGSLDRGPPPPRRGYDNRPPPRDFRDRDRRGPPPPHHRGGREFGRGRSADRRGGSGSMPNRNPNNGAIFFRSYEEEQDWVEDRRRKRLARKSKFDIMPTPEQIAADAAVVALSNPAATDFSGIDATDRNFSAVPQQTRHARRLYIGQLPPHVTEEELHVFFRTAIEQAILPNSPGTVNGRLEDDPILSVYINHERRFCFLEFKTVEMTSACMGLDGIDINGKGKVKIKRPNDYNAAMAPKVAPENLPQLDTSKLGIISGSVPDGPNKIFVGGLHYHLTEDQVLELLQAFGKVKAFHLVKNEPDAVTSKGYCFVEYADPAVTPVATMGLNEMDLGGGKTLTARVAGERSGAAATSVTAVPAVAAANVANIQAAVSPAKDAIPPTANIVHGYDIEALVDAALGHRPMPTAPTYLDNFGMPLTRIVATPLVAAPASPIPAPVMMQQQQQQQQQYLQPQAVAQAQAQPSALDIANAALAAAYGSQQPHAQAPMMAGPTPTRILVLTNMVMPEDLASEDEYNGLQEEVREECAKFGQLLGMQIPRSAGGNIQQSAILKIFLEYATVQDAQAAERELKGRKFGDNVVQTTFFSEAEYASGRLY